jgi:hypothetical protein
MMKKLAFLFVTLFVFNSVYSQDKKPQCENFHTGTFITIEKKYRTKDTVIYVREKNYQTEYIIKNGKVFKSLKVKIIWINDCTYILRNYKHTNNKTNFIVGDIKCKIIETGKDYFVVKAKAKGNKWVLIKFHIYKGEDIINEN